jgi:hypothetical protein
VLFRISVEERTVAELRGFATMLVDELAFSHEQDVTAGRSPLECQHHLRKGIELSRGIYGQRVAGAQRGAAEFFNEELVTRAEAAADSPFQRDVSSILGTGGAARGRVVAMRR